jgi:transcriptional regulator with XRE-family HTH domain
MDRETSIVIPIGERVTRLLQDRAQSPAWLANRVGVERSTISRLVKGERMPNADTLRDVAVAFGMSTADLISGTNAEEPAAEADRMISREHFDAAVQQVLASEREALDLRSGLRQANEELTDEKTRRAAAESRYSDAAERFSEAERRARHYEEDARNARDSLELAVTDVAKWRVEVETLAKTMKAGGRIGRVTVVDPAKTASASTIRPPLPSATLRKRSASARDPRFRSIPCPCAAPRCAGAWLALRQVDTPKPACTLPIRWGSRSRPTWIG